MDDEPKESSGAKRLEVARKELTNVSESIANAVESALGPVAERMADDDEHWAMAYAEVHHTLARIFPAAMKVVQELADGSDEAMRVQAANHKRFLKMKLETQRIANDSKRKNQTLVAEEERKKEVEAKVSAIKAAAEAQLAEANGKLTQLSEALESATVKIKATEDALVTTQQASKQHEARALRAENKEQAAKDELKLAKHALTEGPSTERLSEQLTNAVNAFEVLSRRSERENGALQQELSEKKSLLEHLQRDTTKRLGFMRSLIFQLSQVKTMLKSSDPARKELEEILDLIKQQLSEDMQVAGVKSVEDVKRRVEQEKKAAQMKEQQLEEKVRQELENAKADLREEIAMHAKTREKFWEKIKEEREASEAQMEQLREQAATSKSMLEQALAAMNTLMSAPGSREPEPNQSAASPSPAAVAAPRLALPQHVPVAVVLPLSPEPNQSAASSQSPSPQLPLPSSQDKALSASGGPQIRKANLCDENTIAELVKRAEMIVAQRDELLESSSEHIQRMLSLKSRVSEAEKSLQQHAEREAQRVEHLCTMIARRMLRKDLARGFTAWVEMWEITLHTKQLLGNAAGMLMRPQLTAAWRKWRQDWQESQAHQAEEGMGLTARKDETALEREVRELRKKVEHLEPALASARSELKYRMSYFNNAKRQWEESLKQTSLEFDRLKETTRHERASLVNSALQAMQQLKDSLRAGLDDIVPEPDQPRRGTRQQKANKHRWGVVSPPPSGGGERDSAFLTQVWEQNGGSSPSAPATRTFSSARSDPRRQKENDHVHSSLKRLSHGESYLPSRDDAVRQGVFLRDPTGGTPNALTKSATAAGALPTRNSTVTLITPKHVPRSFEPFPDGPSTDGGELANFIRNAEERRRAGEMHARKLPSLGGASSGKYQ